MFAVVTESPTSAARSNLPGLNPERSIAPSICQVEFEVRGLP